MYTGLEKVENWDYFYDTEEVELPVIRRMLMEAMIHIAKKAD